MVNGSFYSLLAPLSGDSHAATMLYSDSHIQGGE